MRRVSGWESREEWGGEVVIGRASNGTSDSNDRASPLDPNLNSAPPLLALQGFTEESRQADTVHLVVGYRNHRLVSGELGKADGLDAIDFQKI